MVGERRADRAYFELRGDRVCSAAQRRARAALSGTADRRGRGRIRSSTSISCRWRYSGAARRTKRSAGGACGSPKTGFGRALSKIVERTVQRPQHPGVFRRAHPAARCHGGRTERAAQRAARAALAAHGMRAQRASSIGPDLSHRRTLVLHILKTQAVRQAVRDEMQARQLLRRPALLLARKHAMEIAANYSQAFITFMAMLLGRLWNSAVRRRGIRAYREFERRRRRRGNHLRSLPSKPHGLSAAVVHRSTARGLRFRMSPPARI